MWGWWWWFTWDLGEPGGAVLEGESPSCPEVQLREAVEAKVTGGNGLWDQVPPPPAQLTLPLSK